MLLLEFLHLQIYFMLGTTSVNSFVLIESGKKEITCTTPYEISSSSHMLRVRTLWMWNQSHRIAEPDVIAPGALLQLFV